MRPQSRWIMRMVAGLCVSMLFVTTQIPAAQAMDLPDTSSGSSFLSLLSKFFSNNKTEEPEHASEENTELTERKLTGKTPKAEKIEESFDTAVVGSISAAQALNTAKQNVVVTDGYTNVRFVRDVDKQKGADATVTIAGVTYGAKFDEVVPLLALGAGGGDNTRELQKAVDLAAQRGLGVTLSPAQKYVVTDQITLPKGLQYFDAKGAQITVNMRGQADAPKSVFATTRDTMGCKITDMTLNLASAPYTRGVMIDGGENIEVSKIVFNHLTYRAVEMSATDRLVKNITVADNFINNTEGERAQVGHSLSIVATATRDESDNPVKGSRSPVWERYATNGTVSRPIAGFTGLTIINNRIRGGYYGISFSGVSNSVIRGNDVTANTRNISIQNSSNNNLVEQNQLTNSISSGVHIAYDSDNNVVRDNTISSDVSVGQGLLQAYQGCDNTTFEHNSVTVKGDAKSSPSWILLVGTDSHNTKFVGNRIDGWAKRAMVDVESIWDGRSSETNLRKPGPNEHSYIPDKNGAPSPVDNPKEPYHGGRGDLNGTVISGNEFTPRNKNAPVIYVGAEVSPGRSGKERLIGNINDAVIADNVIVGNQFSELLTTHTGKLPGIGEAKIHFKNSSVFKR